MKMKRIISMTFFIVFFSSAAYTKQNIEEFLKLCTRGTQQEVEDAIKAGADVNARNKEGWTALMLAAGVNLNLRVISSLINAGADVNAKTKDGGTALMVAAKYHDELAGVDALINAGADINARNQEGMSPLLFAMDGGSYTVATALIKAGADVNASDKDRRTALMYAVYRRSDALATTLIKAGANVNAKNKYGSTALMAAANNLKLTSILLKAGADVNAKDNEGWTALMKAANPSGVELLTRGSVSTDASVAVINTLLKAGADVNAKNVHGWTALMHAMFDKRLKLIFTLIDAGSDVNARDNDGMTVLMRATQNNSSEVVAALIKAGADVNAKTQDGKTALSIAKQQNDSAIVAALINAGAEERASTKAVVQQKKDEADKEGLSPQDKARIEAAIRKTISLPESAVFSQWGDGISQWGDGYVTIETPSKRDSQWVVYERWKFKMGQDGMISLDGAPRLKGEIDKADKSKPFLDICKSGDYERIKAAAQYFQDVHLETDQDGNNALHIAAIMNHGPGIVKLHVYFGIPHNASNKNKLTPLELYTKQKGNPESIRILEELAQPDVEQSEEEQPKTSQSQSAPPKVPASAATTTYVNSIGIEFVLIPSGSFMMGSGNNLETNKMKIRKNEIPLHKITISKPYYLSKYTVTQAQWLEIMGYKVDRLKGKNNPANVSWESAQKFIERLNAKEGHNRYRLPTEAEWEYAARAGTDSIFFWGNNKNELPEYAWCGSEASHHPVGQKKPNAWGLYDVYGNVFEWVQDWYKEDYYASSPGTDPQGPSSGSMRVFRGGSWNSDAESCRSAYRGSRTPDVQGDGAGFRLAISIK